MHCAQAAWNTTAPGKNFTEGGTLYVARYFVLGFCCRCRLPGNRSEGWCWCGDIHRHKYDLTNSDRVRVINFIQLRDRFGCAVEFRSDRFQCIAGLNLIFNSLTSVKILGERCSRRKLRFRLGDGYFCVDEEFIGVSDAIQRHQHDNLDAEALRDRTQRITGFDDVRDRS